MQAEDWPLIETAPKDGTRVRLWLPENTREVHGHWECEWRPGWGNSFYDDGGTKITGATHWQPIVGPVTETEGGA